MGSATQAANILGTIRSHAQRRLDADNAEMSLGQIVADQIQLGAITEAELVSCARSISHPDHPGLTTVVDLTPGKERFIFSSAKLREASRQAMRRR